MSGQDGFRRFVRTVRKVIRDDVKKSREIPGLSLWVSHQASPRRCAHVPIGAAGSSFDVRANVRVAAREAWSAYVALGRALADVSEGVDAPALSTDYGLVFAGEGRWEAWTVPIVAGDVGGWVHLDERDAGWAKAEVVPLLLSALREVDGMVESCEGCGGKADLIVCSVCGRGGRGA